MKSHGSFRSLQLLILFLSIFFIACEKEEQLPAPSISSFSPAAGNVGTTVTISGQNFAADAGGNVVKVNGITATISSASSHSIVIQVPDGSTTGPITVEVNGQTAMSTTDFEVYVKLVLTSLSPAKGVAGTAITITGAGFSGVLENNQVAINGVPAVVTAATSTSLTVEAPVLGTSGKVEVKANNQTVMSDVIFEYIPKVDNIHPTEVPVNGLLTILGSGFGFDAAHNTVKINGLAAEIVEAGANKLVIRIPNGATTGTVDITSGNQSTTGPVCTIVMEAVIAGGSDSDSGKDVVTDAMGNIYMVGSFQNSAKFGSITLTADGEDAFVVKYDRQGIPIWARSAGGAYADVINSVAIDGAGNLYLAGAYSDNAVFGSLTAAGGSGGFVAKMNASGDFLWVTQFSQTDADAHHMDDVTVDPHGDIVASGLLGGTINWDGENVQVQGSVNAFVVKMSSANGSRIWAKTYPGTEFSFAHAVSCNNDGEIYVGGSFFGTATFGVNSFTAVTSDLDGVVFKLASNGDMIWANQLKGTGWGNVYDVQTDSHGDVLLTGYFGGNLTAPGISVSAFGNENIFVSKLSPAGQAKWTTIGQSNYANGMSLAIDESDNIYMAGYFTSDIQIGGTTITSPVHDRELLVAKLNPNGNLTWNRKAGGTDMDVVYGIFVDGEDRVYTTGLTRNEDITLGYTTLENAGNDDAFLWRIWQPE